MPAAIRPAEEGDDQAIYALHAGAFPTQAEARLVEQLGREGDAVVSLVAEEADEIVGHVLLSRMAVTGDGRACQALGLGPVAVRKDRQGAGTGARLIEAALAVAGATGEEIVFVLGEPAYYRRFGFSAAAAAPFASAYAGPYFMAKMLHRERPLPASGTAEYARAFHALDEAE